MILNPPEPVVGDGFKATYRRSVCSPSFLHLFGAIQWKDYYTPDDVTGTMVPVGKNRMSGKRLIELRDMNGDRHECIAEAFT